MAMAINYNLTGAQRKTLVTAITEILETESKYLGAPSFAYQVGEYHIDKNGTVTGPENTNMVDLLHQNGFRADEKTYADAPNPDELAVEDTSDISDFNTYRAELSDPDYPDRMELFSATDDEDAIRQAYAFTNNEVVLLELHQMDEDYNEVRSIDLPPNPYRLTIEVPLEGFNPEKLDNLCKMVTAKETLLKTALGVETLPIQVREDSIRFPWFWSEDILTAEEVATYSTFIGLLCTTAKEKKRVTAKVGEMPENPKFAFRCFLLSLGMIGDEYKVARKILLSKLGGNSAWKGGPPPKVEPETEETSEV